MIFRISDFVASLVFANLTHNGRHHGRRIG